jgi:hypothetical protein
VSRIGHPVVLTPHRSVAPRLAAFVLPMHSVPCVPAGEAAPPNGDASPLLAGCPALGRGTVVSTQEPSSSGLTRLRPVVRLPTAGVTASCKPGQTSHGRPVWLCAGAESFVTLLLAIIVSKRARSDCKAVPATSPRMRAVWAGRRPLQPPLRRPGAKRLWR